MTGHAIQGRVATGFDHTGTQQGLALSGSSSTVMPVLWGSASTSVAATPRPITEQLVDAFCRLHNAAVALKEAWS